MNQAKTMGGDCRLSETGDRYAAVLADFVAAKPEGGQSRLSVWCSPMKRAVQTARAVREREIEGEGGGIGEGGKGGWGRKKNEKVRGETEREEKS